MLKILIVEDNPDNADMLLRRLVRKGFQVTVAVDGRQGLSMAAAENPDIILMDLSLPEIDGWEATRRLKADAELARIPVIVLSAHASSNDRLSAFSAGCDEFEVKPLNFPRLLSKIETLTTLSGADP